MSCVEIFGFDENGNAYHYGDVRNSFRGAMLVWKHLEEKYLPLYIPDHVTYCNWYYEGMSEEELIAKNGYKPSRVMDEVCKEIWDLFADKSVSEMDRVVLGTTFDNVVVKKENLQKVIDAFLAFDGDSNLPEQAQILKSMIDDKECIAVAWNQTSVNCNVWENFLYNKETDEYIPYNVLVDKAHWFLFDSLIVK